MTDIVSLPFKYNERSYTALITIKKASDHTEYRVTVMNGELEKLLFGHHIIIGKNGHFLTGEVFENSATQQLRQAILGALTNHCDMRMNHRRQQAC